MGIILDLAQSIIDKKDSDHKQGIALSNRELEKSPTRTDIINYLLKNREDPTYLEIGVRNPEDNFNDIQASEKYSVDPGVEFRENPVDFPLTSDVFFKKMKNGQLLVGKRFDIIFIDGLHLAEQVERDINNALMFLKEDGFILVHDCNPPTEWHARETYEYKRTPAGGAWNGTTWKAFSKIRTREDIYSCCIDTDWGLGVISKKINFGSKNEALNTYFEYSVFNEKRSEILNLIPFEDFKLKVSNSK